MFLLRLEQQNFDNFCKYVFIGSIGRRGSYRVQLPSKCARCFVLKNTLQFIGKFIGVLLLYHLYICNIIVM